MSMLESRPIAELNKIALDIFKERIFTDRHIKQGDEKMLTTIFMVIGLGAFCDYDEKTKKDIGLLYEYYDKSMPRNINGYPMFTSVNVLSKYDTELVFFRLNELNKLTN
jgi:hypothetical protein